jgi:hypothetical protein
MGAKKAVSRNGTRQPHCSSCAGEQAYITTKQAIKPKAICSSAHSSGSSSSSSSSRIAGRQH